jgi:TolA-binding protein
VVVNNPVVLPTNPAPPPTPLPTLTLNEANREFAAANYVGAARALARYLELVPSGPSREDVLFRLGVIYSLPVPELQDWPRAQGYLQQLASEFPSSPWKPVGQLLGSLKDQSTALASEIQALKREAAQIQAQVDSLKGNSTQQVAQINELKAKVDQLNSDIDKKNQTIKDLTTDIQRLIRNDARPQSPPRN